MDMKKLKKWLEICSTTNQPILYISNEKTNMQVVNMLLAEVSQISLEKITKGVLTPTEWDSLKTAIAKLKQMPLYHSDVIVSTCSDIHKEIEKINPKPAMVLVDNTQWIVDYDNIGTLSKELNVPIV